jgi:hypothetical protein
VCVHEPDSLGPFADCTNQNHATDAGSHLRNPQWTGCYAERQHCRRSFLLTYLGQNYPGPCGRCDSDDAARPTPPTGAEAFAVGSRVLSERWGEGTVQRYDGDQLTVLFDEHGYRNLLLPLVLQRQLLPPSDTLATSRPFVASPKETPSV